MSHSQESEGLNQQVQEVSARLSAITSECAKRIVGQDELVRRLLTAMIARGHILLEGLPGLAKTTAIKTLSEASALTFSRIQFTPDLLPADVIGTQIYDPKTTSFQVKKGPIFAQLVLADEINRAPAKVQSALLEAMEERQVTIGAETFVLDEPFLVMATQNPIEQEGTYSLPEAQLDRFLFKVLVDYPSAEEEAEIVRRGARAAAIEIAKVASRQEVRTMAELVDQVYVSDKVLGYIVSLVQATRDPEAAGLCDLAGLIDSGASPRASLAFDRVARVNALFEGRSFVTPQDIKDVGFDILRHRVRPTYEAEAQNISADEIIRRIFSQVDVP